MIKDRLREVRKNLGMNQTEFAERLGSKQTTIAGYETGNREIKESIIKLICQTYNINEEWLKFGTGEMFTYEDEGKLELERIYDKLTPALKKYLVQQSRELRKLQESQQLSNDDY